MLFDQTIKNIKRTREIIAVLIKYGFEDFVANTPLQNLVPKKQQLNWSRQEQSIFSLTRWERIRMVFEELGPTFVKLAQVLSNRPDILPDKLIEEFQKLQSDVKPFPFEQVKAILERELGKSIKAVFKHLDEEPIGSASIGQVHGAILRDGTEVVVKVQRPQVRRIVETDLAILKDLVRRADNFFEKNGIVNVSDVVDAFERSMQKELDYTTEARNINSFRSVYADNLDFCVPKVFKEISTQKILVMEFIRGCKITDVAKLKEWGLDPAEIAERGIKIYLDQIFEHGFFHADPHPGNIIIQRNGIICLIDFGMIGTLMKKDKYALAGVFVGMAQQNPHIMASSLRKLTLDDNITDMRSFEYDLNEIIEDFALLDVSESNIADLSNRLQKVIYDYRLRVPGGVFIIFRALAILEGIGKTIHPQFETYKFIKPYGTKLIKEQLDPQNLAEEAVTRGQQFIEFLTTVPVEVRDILIRTRKGKLHFNYELTNYEPILDRADRILNRLALTLVIVALVISSSILANGAYSTGQDLGATGLPTISLIGYSLSAGLGLILLYNILRKRS